MKGVGLGMLVRNRLRKQLLSLQSELDLGPDNATREMIQDEMHDFFEYGKKSGKFADVAFYLDISGSLLRVTSGARCLSGSNAQDDYKAQYMGSLLDSSMDVSGLTGGGPEREREGGDMDGSVDKTRGGGFLSEESFHSPLKFKHRAYRRTAGQVGERDTGTTWFVDAPPSELPTTGTGPGAAFDPSMSTISAKERPEGVPDVRHAFSGGGDETSPQRTKSDYGARKEGEKSRNLHFDPQESSWTEGGPTTTAIPSFVPRTVHELEQYLLEAPNEDVLTIISRRAIHADPTTRWVPFCILPDAAIARLLCCSLLSITSPSFGPMDAHRVSQVSNKSQHRLWANLRALSLYETSLGDEGLITLLQLPSPALKALSFSNTNCSHHVADFIGRSLVGQDSPFPVPHK